MFMIASKFEEILKTPGLSLRQFFRTAADDLFPEAEYHPDVLKCSASNGDRFIKQFMNSPHANLRIFYFQLLRLCYSPSLCHSLPFLNRIKKVVLNSEFNILFSFDTEEQSTLFNNMQFKKLFAEFIDHLDNEEEPCVQNSINDYPIMDIVMIHILRSLLVTRNINPEFHCKIDTSTVFRELSDIFRVKLSAFENYWVFEDSDFLVYAQSDWEIYISYKEKREVKEQVRRRKYINGLLLNKPDYIPFSSVKNVQTHKYNDLKRPIASIENLSITNITSPKNNRFNKSSLKNLNFTSNNSISSRPLQKEFPKTSLKQKLEIEIKKTNPQCGKGQNYEQLNQTMRKGIGSESLAYLGFRNKQNNATVRNISFDCKKQNRSRSVFKGQLMLKGKLFKR